MTNRNGGECTMRGDECIAFYVLPKRLTTPQKGSLSKISITNMVAELVLLCILNLHLSLKIGRILKQIIIVLKNFWSRQFYSTSLWHLFYLMLHSYLDAVQYVNKLYLSTRCNRLKEAT